MLSFSYQVGAVLFGIFLFGVWIVTVVALKGIVSRSRRENQVMMDRMSRQIDRKMNEILSAVAVLNPENRQKPDGNVGILPPPSPKEPADDPLSPEKSAMPAAGTPAEKDAPADLAPQEDVLNPYRDVMPLVREGMDISTIARRLQISEDEVTMVIRMNDS